MSEDPDHRPPEDDFEDRALRFIRTDLARSAPSRRRRIIEKFVLAALGSIPWVGGFISAAVSYKTEEAGLRTDSLQTQWSTASEGRGCEYEFEIGRSYVVYAYGPAGDLTTNICSRTRPETDSIFEMERLGPPQKTFRSLQGCARQRNWCVGAFV